MKDTTISLGLATTGLEPLRHDIIELALLPLDCHLNEMPEMPPLVMRLRATRPDFADQRALALNGLDPAEGMELAEATDTFRCWMADNGIARLAPLGHNLDFALGFLRYRLPGLMSHFNLAKAKDTMLLASMLNDQATAMRRQPPFSSMGRAALCTTLGLPAEQAHRALPDARATAAIYREILSHLAVA